MKRIIILALFFITSGLLFGQIHNTADENWRYDDYRNMERYTDMLRGVDYTQDIYLKHFSNLGFFAGKAVVYNGFLPLIDYLHIADLAVLTKGELQILRNMIFAKHGYIFLDDDWTRFFSYFPWYEPQHRNVETMLTCRENWLIEVIQAFENMQPTSHTKSNYVRQWYNSPIPAAYPDLIEIKDDNTIKFIYNQMSRRVAISCQGTYVVENGILVVHITEQALNGGSYFHGPGGSWSSGMETANMGVFKFNTPIRMVFSIDVLIKYFPDSYYGEM